MGTRSRAYAQFEVVEAGASSADDEGGLTAPMPGKILEVHVSEGQSVTSGDILMVMEAMKMEHKIVASSDGRLNQFTSKKATKYHRVLNYSPFLNDFLVTQVLPFNTAFITQTSCKKHLLCV